ncbi:MAG: hypothetical protein ACRDZR_01095 [Acidimicrobiales bacterium]
MIESRPPKADADQMVMHRGQAEFEKVVLEFILTTAEIKSGIRFKIRHHNRFGWCVGIGIVAIVTGAGLLGIDSAAVGSILIVVGAVDVVLVAGLFEMGIVRQLKKLQSTPSFNANKRIRCELDESGLRILKPIDQLVSWYYYVVQRPKYIILSDREFRRAMVIPRRAFRSTSDEGFFIRVVSTKVRDQKSTLWLRLRGF